MTILHLDQNEEIVFSSTLTVIKDNMLPIFWQLPQITLSVLAECLFQITGNEFAFTQAAPSMKAIVQAIWLSTVAFGDLLVIFIESLKLFDNLSYEFLFYSSLMHLTSFFLMYQAYNYKYRIDYNNKGVELDNIKKENNNDVDMP